VKILSIVSSGFEQGGAEQSVVSYNDAFRKMGHVVRTISSDANPEVKHFSDYEFRAIPTRGFKSFFYSLFNPSAYKVTKLVLKEFQPDVVLLNTMQQVSPSVLLALKKYPTIQCVHGPEAFTKSLLAWHMDKANFKNLDYDLDNLTLGGKLRYMLLRNLYVPAYKFGFKNIKRFLVFSSYTKNILVKDGFTTKPIDCIPIGIKLPETQTNMKKENGSIVYVGRLEKFKGVMDLINAMPSVLESVPDARLELAGDGSYLSELKERVEQLGLKNSVEFKGQVSQVNVARMFAKATTVVVPSTWPETFGKVGVEAMGLGAPVVATDVGGVRDWLHDGQNGILVEPGNPDQLANAIVKIINNPKLRADMSKYARSSTEDFTTDRFARNLLHVIGESVG
jgi:glycosyltransferase involved in cell wall biosynthesis